MEYIRNFVVSIFSALMAYLHPIEGDVKSLLLIFGLNFSFGLLADLLANGESFDFKKAWKCIWEAAVICVLICCIYSIGEHKGNVIGAMQCISFVCYIVFWFYGTNIIRNATLIVPQEKLAYKVLSFIYYVMSVEFVKKIPFLVNYLNQNKAKNEKGC